MPPSSSTRRTRARREVDIREASDADIQDSSPSRPARKKRRTEPAETVTVARDVQAEDQQDDPSKAEDDMEYTSDAVMNHVITTLGLPAEEMPMVSIDHANAVHEREHRNGVQAYAKISGRDWTYYVKTLRVNLGRPPDPVRQSSESAIQTSPPPTDVEETKVHIDLGPSKLVSRQHATIEYDGDGQYNWQMTVHGRNGVRVDDMFIKRGETKGLTSGMVLEIGGTQMMFVTPDDHPVVHPAFIQQARDEERGIIRRNNHSRQIDARRTDLPSDGKMGGATGDSKLSPAYNRGLNLESTEDIDFSHDSAKDLKPPYSYATMIAQAILSASDEKLTLNSIYTWIMDRYAFYRHSNSGWQNSIRHNLSLNKAFEKIPRRTDEPGKGMKWQIVPGHYEEFTKKAARPSKGAAGQRTSSAPNSPLTRDTSANTSYQGLPAYGPPLRLDPVRDNPSGSNRIKRSATPPSYSVPSKVAYTPTRGPLPHRQNGTTPTDEVSPTHGNNKNGGVLLPTYNTSPPTLSSRYDDENNGASMATPAPRRQNPKLAPPSAAQMPSSYLPTSSPAPFWKYVDVGSTPAKPMGDLSPFKLDKGAPSSPPARRSSAGGPDESSTEDRSIKKEPDGDKEMASNGNGQVGETATTQDDETEGFDLTKGFQAIGKYHTNLTNAAA